MTAAAAEAWGRKPSQVAEGRPSLGQGGAPYTACSPRRPAHCLGPTLPRAEVRSLRKILGAVIPKDQAYQGQANTLRHHLRQGHKTQNCGFGSSDLTYDVTSKSQPHPLS